MKQYLDLLQKVIKDGVEKTDRTGTGTISLFGTQMKFNLQEGFPLLTTKKMFTRGMIEELLWFISGSTDVNVLKDKNVHIWDYWVKDDGTIGAGYGKQMRELDTIRRRETRSYSSPLVLSEPVLWDNPDPIRNVWQGMMLQAANGDATVSKQWQVFDKFEEDFTKIPRWSAYLEYPLEYDLDPNCMYFTNSHYSLDTVMFNKVDYALLNNTQSLVAYEYTDQLKEVIAEIKHNPSSRRLNISLWNAQEISHMKLPCCHGNMITFNVTAGKLNCLMYQRSGDLFLGVPFNIASYALFTMMIAKTCGLEPGTLTLELGDSHVYLNHLDQVRLQLTRDPKPLPMISFPKKDITEYSIEDFTLSNYEHHPRIKGEVAI